MEKRQITQVKIYVLVLNNMYGRCEDGNVVAISPEYENLIKYYNDNLLPERIRDNEGYIHSFKEGGLYFYNPCYSLEVGSVNSFGYGINFEWYTEDILHSGRDILWYKMKLLSYCHIILLTLAKCRIKLTFYKER